MRKWLRTLIADDRVVGWIVALFVLSELLAIGWDLPGSYGWENDGLAPREFFAGIAHNLTPGMGYRYPLFHALIVGVLCLPFMIPAALASDAWTLPALKEQMLAVPVMTACSVTAKLLSVAMAAIALLVLGRIARRTVNQQAARWTVLLAATCLSFAYYGRVSNLDGPYLMWTVLAIDRLLTVVESRSRRDYVIFGILAGAAVATKDQAYAGFVLPAVLYLLLLPQRRDRPFGQLALHYENVGFATLAGALSLGVLSGAFLNPTGFLVRLSELTGSASQDWSTYARTPTGVAVNALHLLESQEIFFWPWPVVVLCWAGVASVIWNPGGEGLRSRTFRLLPIVAGASSILFFALIVGRCGHRFSLPFGFWLAYYGGVASAELVTLLRERGMMAKRIGQVALGLLVVWSGAHSFELHLTQLGDARREVAAYLDELPRNTRVETYGHVVHLPHFDFSDTATYRLQRVSRRPIPTRNPLIGAEEIDAPYGRVTERRPDVLVIPENYAIEFLPREQPIGMPASGVSIERQADADARQFFQSVIDDSLEGYQVVLIAEPALPSWARVLGAEPVKVHSSVGGRQWVLRRTADDSQQ